MSLLLICDQWLTKSLGQKTLGQPLIWLNGHSSVLLQFLEFINIYFLFELHTLESKKKEGLNGLTGNSQISSQNKTPAMSDKITRNDW